MLKSDVIVAEIEAVQAASDRFYRALNQVFAGSIDPMVEAWAHTPEVILMGPFGGRHAGWDDVRQSLEETARLTRGGRVEPADLLVRVSGDVAYSVCQEQGLNVDVAGNEIPIDHRATTIFQRMDGEWKVVHRHTDINSELQGIVQAM